MLSLSRNALGLAMAGALLLSATALPVRAEVSDPAGQPEAAHVTCTRSGGTVNCAANWGAAGGPPLIIRVAPHTDEAARTRSAERDSRWEAYCKPRLWRDRYGVGRYAYAAEGCEFGRDAD